MELTVVMLFFLSFLKWHLWRHLNDSEDNICNFQEDSEWKFLRCSVQGMIFEVLIKTNRGRFKKNNIESNSIFASLCFWKWLFYLRSRLLGVPVPPSLLSFLLFFYSSFSPFILLSFLPLSLPPFLPSFSYSKWDGEQKRKTSLSPGVWEQEWVDPSQPGVWVASGRR